MLVKMDVVTVTEETVEVPETCPKCGANFTDSVDTALVRYDLRSESERGHLDGTGKFEFDGADNAGDGFAGPINFGCDRCAWMLR